MSREQKDDLELIVDTIQSVLPKQKKVSLHEPNFQGNEWIYVKECLDTGWVSSVGKYVDRFEEKLAEFTGVKRAVAVINGTAALHICLKLAGVEPNDEVLVPTLTFIATANAVTYCGAVSHFVDSEEKSLGMDATKLRDYLRDIAEKRSDGCYNRQTGRRIRAAVPMHTFGHPVDLDEMVAVCEEFSLVLVEDAAESLGSYYKGKHTGNWGKVSALSFNGNKIITTGGGGAVLTNDEELGRLAKHITTTAKLPHRWEFFHDQIGYNYRMPNINAALGCAQLEQLPFFLESKRRIAEKYTKVFSNCQVASILVEQPHVESNYWLNSLLLNPAFAKKRDELLHLLHTKEIFVRPAWNLMHQLPIYSNYPRMSLEVAQNISSRLINLPSSACLVNQI